MVSDIGLIAVSLISLAGMVLLFTLNNSTWFKKENFKIQKKNVMDENRIKLKKLEKDMGLTSKSSVPVYQEQPSMLETGGNLLNMAKNLTPEQLQLLAGKFLKEDEGYDEKEPGLLEKAFDFAQQNPEIAQQFLSGIVGIKKGENTQTDIYEG